MGDLDGIYGQRFGNSEARAKDRLTTKSRLPQHPLSVRWHLHVRRAWRLFGGRTLYIGWQTSSTT